LVRFGTLVSSGIQIRGDEERERFWLKNGCIAKILARQPPAALSPILMMQAFASRFFRS